MRVLDDELHNVFMFKLASDEHWKTIILEKYTQFFTWLIDALGDC